MILLLVRSLSVILLSLTFLCEVKFSNETYNELCIKIKKLWQSEQPLAIAYRMQLEAEGKSFYAVGVMKTTTSCGWGAAIPLQTKDETQNVWEKNDVWEYIEESAPSHGIWNSQYFASMAKNQNGFALQQVSKTEHLVISPPIQNFGMFDSPVPIWVIGDASQSSVDEIVRSIENVTKVNRNGEQLFLLEFREENDVGSAYCRFLYNQNGQCVEQEASGESIGGSSYTTTTTFKYKDAQSPIAEQIVLESEHRRMVVDIVVSNADHDFSPEIFTLSHYDIPEPEWYKPPRGIPWFLIAALVSIVLVAAGVFLIKKSSRKSEAK